MCLLNIILICIYDTKYTINMISLYRYVCKKNQIQLEFMVNEIMSKNIILQYEFVRLIKKCRTFLKYQSNIAFF